MLDALTADDFRPRVGETFVLTAPTGDRTDSVLSTVTEHDANPVTTRRPFSLVFLAPADSQLDQGVHRVTGDGILLDLFLVPIGPDPDGAGMQYEAVFG